MQPERRWFRFGLRTMLIVVTLCAVAVAWVAVPAEQQKYAASLTLKHGGSVLYRHDLDESESSEGEEFAGPVWLRGIVGDDYFQTLIGVSAPLDDNEMAAIGRVGTLEFLGPMAGFDGEPRLVSWREHAWRSTRTNAEFTDEGARYVAGLRRLRHVDLSHTAITDEGLRHLAGCREIRSLSFLGTKVTDAGLVHLCDLKRLKDIEVWDFVVTDSGVRHLAELPALERLGPVAIFEISDRGARWLPRLENLEAIVLSGDGITDETLIYAARMPRLRQLTLVGCPRVTDSGFAALATAAVLSHLTLRGCAGVSDEGFVRLAAGGSVLETMTLRDCEGVTDAGLAAISDLPNLSAFHAFWLEHVTAAGLMRFAERAALKRFAVSGCPDLRTEQLRELHARVPQMEVYGTGIDGQGHVKSVCLFRP